MSYSGTRYPDRCGELIEHASDKAPDQRGSQEDMMSVELQLDCDGAQGNAASFVTAVNFYVDGVLVKVVEHTPVPGEPDRWSFSVPFDFEGTHTIRVTDTAASGPTEYFVAESDLVCSVTATSPAPPPTVLATVASVPGTVATTTTVAPTTPESTATSLAPTTASVLAETVSVAPATLPATGSTTGPLIDVGLGFLLAGLVATFAARRRLHRA